MIAALCSPSLNTHTQTHSIYLSLVMPKRRVKPPQSHLMRNKNRQANETNYEFAIVVVITHTRFFGSFSFLEQTSSSRTFRLLFCRVIMIFISSQCMYVSEIEECFVWLLNLMIFWLCNFPILPVVVIVNAHCKCTNEQFLLNELSNKTTTTAIACVEGQQLNCMRN